MQALLRELDLRQFRLLLIGAGSVIVTLVVVYAVVPPWKAYLAADKAVSVLERVSREGGELEALLGKHAENIDGLKRKLHGDMADLPEKQIESYIIGKLQRVSWRNEVELISVQPSAGENVQIFRETLFRVQLAGRYETLYRWLWEARNELGFVVIKEYRLERRDTADENPQLLANLVLASYRAER